MGRTLAALSPIGTGLTGIVATTDNGGSTGRLREQTGCIAWGDARNCLNQLSKQQTSLNKLLFEYRFPDGGELSNHNLGNLMLLAADNICARPLDALDLVRQLLNIPCRLIPMSEQVTDLCAKTAQGEVLHGELSVDAHETLPEALFLEPQVATPAEALDSVADAQVIVLAPGSFLTSVVPPLLLPDLAANISQKPCLMALNLNADTDEIGRQIAWLNNQLGFAPSLLLGQARQRPKNWPEDKFHADETLHSEEGGRLHETDSYQQALLNAINRLLDRSQAVRS